MKAKTIAYWVTTVIIAFCIGSGGLMAALRVPGVVDGMVALGYPVHFIVLLGIWKMLGVITLLAPRFPLVKEWAYAGIFFDLTGAMVANGASGSVPHVFAPFALVCVLAASWWLRPDDRKLAR